MPRLVLVLPALAVVAVASAAPVPKERPEETLRRLFGTPSDPDHDCKIELDGARLRITVPGRPHRLVPNGGPSNAPRVTRPVEGDFTATVTIKPPKPGPNAQGNYYAGLFVQIGGDTVVYHTRHLVVGNGRTLAGLRGLRVGVEPLASGTGTGELYDGEAVVFRLTRAGNRFRPAVSKDGTTWADEPEIVADRPARLAVGVFAAHDTNAPLTAEFQGFAVTGPKH